MSTLLESINKRSQHGAWIEIHLSHLLHNLEEIKKTTGTDKEIMAIIKANAYGHGAVQIAKTLNGKVSYFGVASIPEALALKELELNTPIFMFGRYFSQELPSLLVDGITLTVSSLDEAKEISDLSSSLNRKTKVHVKIDTGMGRMGIAYREALHQVEQIALLPHLELEGIYTHFPTADADDDFALRQLADFTLLIRMLERKSISFRYRHAANSAGTMKLSDNVMNLVRPGIMLYGIYPSETLRDVTPIKPVLQLKTRINFIKHLRANESVGYGRTYMTHHATNIAILPIGYSHGYPWSASGKAYGLFHGKRFKIAGRISMDYLALDLEDEHAELGEEVTLIGENGHEVIRTEDMARWAATIPYEIVTQLAPHLPRFYH